MFILFTIYEYKVKITVEGRNLKSYLWTVDLWSVQILHCKIGKDYFEFYSSIFEKILNSIYYIYYSVIDAEISSLDSIFFNQSNQNKNFIRTITIFQTVNMLDVIRFFFFCENTWSELNLLWIQASVIMTFTLSRTVIE